MSWKETYRSRQATAEEATAYIKSGDRVIVGHACGEPSYLLDVMVQLAEDYRDVEIVHMVAMGSANTASPRMRRISATTPFLPEATAATRSLRDAEILPRYSSIGCRSCSIPRCRWMRHW